MTFRVVGNTVKDLIAALQQLDPDTKHCVDAVLVDHTTQGRKLRIALDESVPGFEDSVSHPVRPTPSMLQKFSNSLEAYSGEVSRKAEEALDEALRDAVNQVMREVSA